MPKQLVRIFKKKRVIGIFLSKDWHTLTPWSYAGELVNYFSIYTKISDSGDVKFTHLFIGPFAVLYAKWIRN